MRSQSMRAASLTALVTVAALGATARAAAAQSSLALTPFVSYYRSTDVASPTTAGADLAIFGGPLGIRGSAAIPVRGPTDRNGSRGWDGDLDFVVRLADPMRTSSAFVPYIFGGIGGRSRPDAFRDPVWTHTRSLGAGAQIALTRSLGFSAEARWRFMRELQTDGTTPWRADNAAEVRIGVSLGR